MSSRSIADYALLSDCHSAALVARDGSIEWLCLPRFDSPSIFARLLDEDAGHFVLLAVGAVEVTRGYRDRSLVLETTFLTQTGRGVLVDALAFGEGERGHDIGIGSAHVLLRRLTCLEGELQVEVDVAPRPGYGGLTEVAEIPGGALFESPAGRLVLSAPHPLELRDGKAYRGLRLSPGEACALALSYLAADERPVILTDEQIAARIEDTTEGWRSWSAQHQAYDGPWADLVQRSGCVMQGLTYRPTGAMVAAPTTSLPEEIGGVRNWDYRFSWLRDSSMILQALWVAACPDEASDFFGWMASTAERDAEAGLDLQIVYGIGAERDLTERTLPLRGWRDSRPVRVGNAAAHQRQIDLYGEILDAAHLLLPTVHLMTPPTRRFLVGLADTAARLWHEPDQGIWEIRGPARHFVHSKLMCWVAVDRAIAMVDALQAFDRVRDWAEARDAIRAAIEREGWNAEAGCFAQSFGDDALDASTLMLCLTGFLTPDDPRIRATVAAVAGRLTDERGLVLRYEPRGMVADGVPGGEGAFLLCTYWLAQCLAMMGEVSQAREAFERVTAYANDLLLLAEEVHPQTGELLGNFPQAMSHIGLVNAAWAIAEAERRAG